jgi:hypothetical protein
MKWFIYSLVLILAILHQDFWLWDSTKLLLGFLPIGLAYHILYSILAALLWIVAIRFAWPKQIENWASE